ncbi:unnamed protein product, partial [Mycena citricolor]
HPVLILRTPFTFNFRQSSICLAELTVALPTSVILSRSAHGHDPIASVSPALALPRPAYPASPPASQETQPGPNSTARRARDPCVDAWRGRTTMPATRSGAFPEPRILDRDEIRGGGGGAADGRSGGRARRRG